MATRTARSVARLSSFSSLSPLPRPAPLPRLRLAAAKTGDHPSIHGLLVSVFHGPSTAEFQSQLDEPGYEPADRIIVKDDDQIAAHLRLARQTIQVGAATLPAARFMDLATAPEYRSRGLATALLAAGERAAAERGVLVGLTRTRAAELFARQGWTVCGRHIFSTASPQAVLAELASAASSEEHRDQSSVLPCSPPESIQVRPLRRVELRGVVRLYERHIAGQSGWPVRGEPYWEWLLARGACDQVYVASSGPETTDFAKLLDSIVGYICVRRSRIVELVVTGGRHDVARRLVERVCADAREQDGWSMRCDAPTDDPLIDLFRRAGGRVTVTQEVNGELFMAKLLDPLAVLREMTPVFAARAAAAGLSHPCELGIELRCGGGRRTRGASGVVERFRLCLGKRDARVETGGPSRHAIVLSYGELAPLVLGDVGADTMAHSRRLSFTTKEAQKRASALLPGGIWWRPALDDLLA